MDIKLQDFICSLYVLNNLKLVPKYMEEIISLILDKYDKTPCKEWNENLIAKVKSLAGVIEGDEKNLMVRLLSLFHDITSLRLKIYEVPANELSYVMHLLKDEIKNRIPHEYTVEELYAILWSPLLSGLDEAKSKEVLNINVFSTLINILSVLSYLSSSIYLIRKIVVESKGLGLLTSEIRCKYWLLASSRIPLDMRAASNLISGAILYSALTLYKELTPFLVLRPPAILNPMFVSARKGSISKLPDAFNRIAFVPAIATAVVVGEANLIDELCKKVNSALREYWGHVVNKLENEVSTLLSDIIRGKNPKAIHLVKIEENNIKKLLSEVRENPPYTFTTTYTYIENEFLKDLAKHVLGNNEIESHEKYRDLKDIVCSKGFEVGNTLWCILSSLSLLIHTAYTVGSRTYPKPLWIEPLDAYKVSNPLCSNCYYHSAIIRSLVSHSFRIPFRVNERLCPYHIILRLACQREILLKVM